MVIIRNSINESESLKKDCVAEAKGRVTMIMTQKEMLFIVQSQLAIDLNCSIDDLNGEKDSIIFVEAKENPGCRPFPRKARYFEICRGTRT